MSPPAPPRRSFSSQCLAAAVICGLFLAACIPIIISGLHRGRASFDQTTFHFPTIRQFAQQWPHFDFADYHSATTPGYHVVMAAALKLVGDHERILRLISCLFTIGLLATFAVALASRAGAAMAIAFALPLLTSVYVFSSGVWLLPENVSWWALLAILLLALRPRVDGTTYIGGGLLLLAVVLTRQTHLWCAALLWLAAWLGPGGAPSTEGNTLNHVREDDRIRRVVLMVLATIPSFLLIAWFFRLWHGPTPPMFSPSNVGVRGTVDAPQSHHQGINPAMPALILATTGLLSLFYFPALWPSLRDRLRPRSIGIALSALAGAFIGLVPRTSYNIAAGRYTGLWNLAKPLPTFCDRSVLIVELCIIGGVAIYLWLLFLSRRDRFIFLAAWVLFTIAHTANAAAWYRYVEPFVIIWLGLVAIRVVERSAPLRPIERVNTIAGPAVLALLLADVTLISLR